MTLKRTLGLALTANTIIASSAFASEALSFLEDPLAIHIGDTTFQLRGSLEQSAAANLDKEIVRSKSSARMELSAETRLRNSWTVRASYEGTYDSRPGSITDVGGGEEQEEFTDALKLSLGTSWGTVSAGNVNEVVATSTNRKPNVGNAALAFENGFGSLGEWAVGYSGRFGPTVISAVADDDAGMDLGLRFSRPIGNKDLGFAIRGTIGRFISQDNAVSFSTRGVIASADIIYGSSLIDLKLGAEELRRGGMNIARIYSSLGVQHKIAALTLSAAGHYGQLDGKTEVSAALGAQYDFARGLSANIGLNYAKLNAQVSGVNVVSKDALEAVASVRYEF